ncbi:hypothetical protein Mpsy_0630 [Methanolobus psychrophilus R15]|nr:hypothetical protein Mpsy_0630 [Methanolobus psychrophilus R15]
MNYFQTLGIIFGLAALLKPFYMHLLLKRQNQFISKAYTKERPKWIVPVAIIGLSLVAFTWYKELTTDIPFSIIITILFSLTAIKAIYFLVNYSAFQKWVAGMLEKDDGKKITVLNALTGVFGLIVIIISLVLY